MCINMNAPLNSLLIRPEAVRHHRTIWISDVHLGTAGCKAKFLLDFLRYNESDTLYLVGDIIDGWQLKKGWRWDQSHNDVVQKILRAAYSFITTQDDLIGNAVEDVVVGQFYPGANWIVKGENNVTNGWIKLEMR